MRQSTLRILSGALLVPLLGACASGGSIRQLGELELQTLNKVDSALAANEAMMSAAAASLGELGAAYAALEFDLELKMVQAQRLEAMRAPWAAPPDDLVATQRAVVLYHLYEVELAQQKVLDARMAERRAAGRNVLEAYQRLAPLLRDASQNMEVLLEHLNQPKDARIRMIANAFLGEVASFRTTLQSSANPELQGLAADVARYEDFANRAKEQAAAALNGILKPGGNDDG